MHPTAFPSRAALEERVRARVAALVDDRDRLLPAWIDRKPAELLRDRKFIVCGSVCRSEIRVLARHAEVIGIVDDALSKERDRLFGISLLNSDAWIERARGDASIVSCILVPHGRATQYFTRQCVQWNLQTLSPLQFLHMLRAAGADIRGETGRFFWYGYEFFSGTLDNADRLIDRADIFADEYSKLSWLAILMYRLTLDPGYLEGCAVGFGGAPHGLDSYAFCRRFLRFDDAETYVDGGAFNGDTVEAFLRAVDGRFERIHAFEPSAANNHEIRNRIRRLQDEFLAPLAPRITLHGKGLWDGDAELRFNPNRTVDEADLGTMAGALAAHIVEAGMLTHVYDESEEDGVAVRVPVTSIDAATDTEATFIKLEIEGAELQALNGARQTIARQRPQMAISIYHKPEDLLTLTDFVLATGQGYTLGFRQHNPFAPDAMVMYCGTRA